MYWSDAGVGAVRDEKRDFWVFVEDAGGLESCSPFSGDERGAYFRVAREDTHRLRAGVSHNRNTREGVFRKCRYSGSVVANPSR